MLLATILVEQKRVFDDSIESFYSLSSNSSEEYFGAFSFTITNGLLPHLELDETSVDSEQEKEKEGSNAHDPSRLH